MDMVSILIVFFHNRIFEDNFYVPQKEPTIMFKAIIWNWINSYPDMSYEILLDL